jgi:hypothetical protein
VKIKKKGSCVWVDNRCITAKVGSIPASVIGGVTAGLLYLFYLHFLFLLFFFVRSSWRGRRYGWCKLGFFLLYYIYYYYLFISGMNGISSGSVFFIIFLFLFLLN